MLEGYVKDNYYTKVSDLQLSLMSRKPNFDVKIIKVNGSVVPIAASYRKLVATAKNRRLSIENFHNRLSVIVLG